MKNASLLAAAIAIASVASAAPQVLLMSLKDGKTVDHIAIPFQAGESRPHAEITEVRYSDIDVNAGRLFGDAFVVDGLKWKAELQPDGGLKLKVAKFEKVGVAVVNRKAYPVLNGDAFETTVYPSKDGATVSTQHGTSFRVVLVPEPEKAKLDDVRKSALEARVSEMRKAGEKQAPAAPASTPAPGAKKN